MFENLCSGLRRSISKDVLSLLNHRQSSACQAKPLLTAYFCLWLAALLWCKCMRACLCPNLPVRLCEDTSYLMSLHHTKVHIVGRCCSCSYNYASSLKGMIHTKRANVTIRATLIMSGQLGQSSSKKNIRPLQVFSAVSTF